MSEFLTAAELRELTGYRAAGRQDTWLTEQGIPHRKVGGRTIVSRNHVRDWLEGKPSRQSVRPDFSMINA